MTLPVAITSDGNFKAVWVPTIADPANPTVTECTSVSCVDLTCYLTGDGWTPSVDKQVVTDDRLCSRETFEDIGRRTNKLTVKYIFRAQDPDAADNLAYKTLKDGTAGYVVTRWGLAYEGDLAAGDWANVIPVRCNLQEEMPPVANAKLMITQDLMITNTMQRQVQITS